MNAIKNWLKKIRNKALGLAEIEELLNEKNRENQELITQLQHNTNQRNDYIQHSINKLDEQTRNIQESVDILSSPEKLIPQLNSYTGKYYMALEYPPSRDYQPRWGYTKPPHSGLSKIFHKDFDEHCQTLENLAKLKPFFDKINIYFDHENSGDPAWLKTPLNAFDAALIYYFVTDLKAKNYLEIGSGVSTLFAARAIKDHNLETKTLSIDPDPRAEVDAVCDRVIRDGLETCELEIFSQLEPGDILFFDGSHRSFMNSDVTVFMMDVLPMIKPGVIIGVHDILLPYDYPDSFKNWYWNEQYMFAVYLLAAANKLKILMPGRYMSFRPELEEAFSAILKDWKEDRSVWLNGGSLWFTHLENS